MNKSGCVLRREKVFFASREVGGGGASLCCRRTKFVSYIESSHPRFPFISFGCFGPTEELGGIL